MADTLTILDSPEALSAYDRDASRYRGLPAAVLLPATAEQVPQALAWARQRGMSIVARAGGTGMTGAAVSDRPQQAILSLERLRSLRIDVADQLAHAGAGVITGQLDMAAREQGLWYPVDPSSLASCTIGGNVATNAGGPRAFKFGVTRSWVTRVAGYRVDGSHFQAGSAAAKDVAGYDMIGLLCGSEGTLAIVTEVTVRLLPGTPRFGGYVIFAGPAEVEDLIATARQSWPRPAALEFFDHHCATLLAAELRVVIRHGSHAMLIEWLDESLAGDSEPLFAAQVTEAAAQLLERSGVQADATVAGVDARAHARLWQVRRAMSQAMFRLGTLKYNEDIALRASVVPQLLQVAQSLERQLGITIAIFGHVGDGNLHVNVMHEPERAQAAAQAVERLFAFTAQAGGTVTGEHGVGQSKKRWLAGQVDARWIDQWRQIKTVFDPENRLNPGKIFD